MELCLRLPWPPSVNHYKKVGRLVKTKTGKLYQQRVDTNETKTFYFQVYMLAKQSMPQDWKKIAKDESKKFEVRVYFYPPNEYRYDMDNLFKTLFDGLVRAHVIPDDSNLHRLYAEKCHMINQGEVVVRIQEI